jgi:hypothetical protein
MLYNLNSNFFIHTLNVGLNKDDKKLHGRIQKNFIIVHMQSIQ